MCIDLVTYCTKISSVGGEVYGHNNGHDEILFIHEESSKVRLVEGVLSSPGIQFPETYRMVLICVLSLVTSDDGN